MKETAWLWSEARGEVHVAACARTAPLSSMCPGSRHKVGLDADHESYGTHSFAETKLQFTGEIVRIVVRTE